jgi:agmatine deiminase
MRQQSVKSVSVWLAMVAYSGLGLAADSALLAGDDFPVVPHAPAPGERIALPLLPFAPPNPPVHTPAEFAPNDGMLIRWGTYNALLTDMTVKATQSDQATIVWIVVASSALQSTATTTLQNAGAVMNQVRFIVAASNSVWMRDYGPRFIANNGARAIVDHTYNRNRPADDAMPGVIATAWNEPKFDIPLVHGGGNFHLFEDGDAFMTGLIRNENSSLTEQQIKDYYAAYEGVNLTITDPFPTSFDSTQHIDMWMLPVANKRVIISEYPTAPTATYGVPRTVTEQTATDMTTRGYTVLRTPGWSESGTHYTYANSVILNKVVLLCKFGGTHTTEDATALATFSTAFAGTGRNIAQVDCAGIITASGAIHCIVMHVPTVLSNNDVLLVNGFE